MAEAKKKGIIVLDQFVQAVRDAGYKDTASAIAELIDNSFEASATRVEIQITNSSEHRTVSVTDNGSGMTPSTLPVALQFGGSTRFNSRVGAGRYGMGLPNSSLSQARRVDVFTWRSRRVIWWSYLDVDQIIEGRLKSVPVPRRVSYDTFEPPQDLASGTTVVWSKCDRLDYKREKTLVSRLQQSLGRIFRHHLWHGKAITINGELVQSVDPLFLRKGRNPAGAICYGPPLKYAIDTNLGFEPRRSTVHVVFSELPISDWHFYSNEEKRFLGVSSGAGVSIIRANREIDHGWFFMGAKRKENYDDWWRCEVRFTPELDDWFGVTNTKQGIRPSAAMEDILTPDMERIARILNSRVRQKYFRVRSTSHSTARGRSQAENRDHLLEPPVMCTVAPISHCVRNQAVTKRKPVSGLTYRIEHSPLEDSSFFVSRLSARELIVLLNEQHPFYERFSTAIMTPMNADTRRVFEYLELLLFAAARAKCSLVGSATKRGANSFLEAWSRTLAAFLG